MKVRLVISLAVLLWTVSARSQVVELTADIELVSWSSQINNNPPHFQSHVWKTHCIVSTNSWFISVSNDETFPETWRYDGANITWRIPDPRQKKSETASATNYTYTTRTLSLTSMLETDAALPPIFRTAWLAFCSGSHLNQTNAPIPLLSFLWKQTWLHYDHAAPPAGFENKIVRFEDALGLPVSIDVLAKAGQPVFQYRLKYDHPRSPASTNVAGWDFPLQFRAIQYQPLGGTNQFETYLTAHAKLTSIKPVEDPHTKHER